jgi:hypothetical protein
MDGGGGLVKNTPVTAAICPDTKHSLLCVRIGAYIFSRTGRILSVRGRTQVGTLPGELPTNSLYRRVDM